MLTIIGAGDSFIYGSELSDCLEAVWRNEYKHSDSTFTALLAKDYNYKCIAWPGFGNDSIARNVIAYCEGHLQDSVAVIVSWTFPGRYEFRFNYNTQQRTSPWYTITPWTIKLDVGSEYHTENDAIEQFHARTVERAKNTGIHSFAQEFYRHVGDSEYWEIYSSLKEIVYLTNYLKIKNIPYLFTCADNSLRFNGTIGTPDPTIHSLLQQVNWDEWFWFPAGVNPQDTQNPRGFYQWAVENKYRMGTTHPLEEAHQCAAQLIQGKFNEMVNKYLG